MDTRIVRIYEDHPNPPEMADLGIIIKDGGLVAFPTETVYGLGGDALNPESSKKIYAAKGRPSDNPLIVHIANLSDLDALTEEIPESAKKLADAFWPGPLTMILKKSASVPKETTGGLDTVAVRFPSHKVAQELIKAGGGYIAAPSANLSGKPSPTTGRDVLEDMDGRIDMILDDGESVIGLESTIIDMTEEPPVLLRPGAVTVEMIRECIPDLSTGQESRLEKEAHPRAPGMKYRHYAPQAPLILVDSDQAIRDLCVQATGEGKKVGVLTSREHASFYEAPCVRILGGEADEEEMAHNLFASLRAFDREGVDVIYSETFDEQGIGMALMNRLRKAAQKG